MLIPRFSTVALDVPACRHRLLDPPPFGGRESVQGLHITVEFQGIIQDQDGMVSQAELARSGHAAACLVGGGDGIEGTPRIRHY
jgi:hypothetical protein